MQHLATHCLQPSELQNRGYPHEGLAAAQPGWCSSSALEHGPLQLRVAVLGCEMQDSLDAGLVRLVLMDLNKQVCLMQATAMLRLSGAWV